ncbi:MAG: hypothetical protein WKF48_13620, partial [Solirubrobacteraceae bacterium]
MDRLPRARRLSRGRRRALRPGPVQLRGYPFTTFLFAPQDIGYPGQPNIVGVHHFGDFYEPWVTSQGPHPYVDFPLTFASSYFPVTHILLFPLAQLPLTVALVLYLVVFVALFGATIFRHVVKARHPVRRSFVAAADVAALGLSLALAGEDAVFDTAGERVVELGELAELVRDEIAGTLPVHRDHDPSGPAHEYVGRDGEMAGLARR